MQLSIIIVNYNVKFFLEQCLSSVHKAIEKLETEVWVVDNASTDGSIEYLKQRFSFVKFVENPENTGFSKGNNSVLYQCKGKYVLFLNPDTLIAEDCLLKCIKFLELNALIGALGIRMIDGSGRFLPESKRSFPTPLASLYKLAGLSRMFPKSPIFSRYALGYLDEHKDHEIEVLSGAFMMVKKDLLIQLKGFDEAFFMYGEDIDLSYRIVKSGYKNYYFSDSTVIHFKGESTKKNNLGYVKNFYKAMSIFVKKHYSKNSGYLFPFFLNMAIWLRAGVEAGMRIVLKTVYIFTGFAGVVTGKKKNGFSTTIIVGTQEEYEEIKTLLAKAGIDRKIFGRIATGLLEEENALGTVDQLKELVDDLAVTEIIFCEGKLGYSSIIKIVEDLPEKLSFRFHSHGTESIVGSDSKETTGEFVTVDKKF